MSILTDIFGFFVGIFNEIKKAWLKLSPEIQTATLQASGIIAIINANVAATPDIVWQLIETKYPNVTKTSLTTFLAKVNNTVNAANTVAESATFEQALTTLQTYLNGLTGNTFITVVKTVVVLLADLFAPGTVIQKIELVLEWVYLHLVKNDVPVAAAA